MKADLTLKLQYTEVARATRDGAQVIAMRQRVKDQAGAGRTTEWVYMEPFDAETLIKTLQRVMSVEEQAKP